MRIVETKAELRDILAPHRRAGESVGFVPTMGYLHEGHAALVRRARAENALVVVSIFVNPMQFGPGEDYARYPRDPERDAALLESLGVDVLFLPAVEEMYGSEGTAQVRVDPGPLGARLCGAFRPGHFTGVATVVSKLFHLVEPTRAYFGLKDAQQVAIIRRMVEDLDFPVEIVGVPTVREADGLALSSRNVYLTPEERRRATALYRALEAAWAELLRGERRGKVLTDVVRGVLAEAEISPEYVALVTYPALEDVEELPEGPPFGEAYLLALAARIGVARLIDNMIFARTAEGLLRVN
ncbi:MAG: pantoate--beta-alanine ligase [Brockia lithotrophica]|nr:pantoate--beta-alanine ligase [Brockia lithotrophica]